MDGEVFTKPAGPATASGFTTRVENNFAKLATLPDQLAVDVEDMIRERDMLIPRIDTRFEHSDALRDKRVELEQIKSAIAAEASTPEAQAARAAAAERLKVAGRKPGWSLQWNPTNHMVEEAGLSSREEYRVAAQRIEESRAAAYAAEKEAAASPTPNGDGGRADTPPPMTPAQRAAAIASRGVARTSPVTGARRTPESPGAAAGRRDAQRPRDHGGPSR